MDTVPSMVLHDGAARWHGLERPQSDLSREDRTPRWLTTIPLKQLNTTQSSPTNRPATRPRIEVLGSGSIRRLTDNDSRAKTQQRYDCDCPGRYFAKRHTNQAIAMRTPGGMLAELNELRANRLSAFSAIGHASTPQGARQVVDPAIQTYPKNATDGEAIFCFGPYPYSLGANTSSIGASHATSSLHLVGMEMNTGTGYWLAPNVVEGNGEIPRMPEPRGGELDFGPPQHRLQLAGLQSFPLTSNAAFSAPLDC